MILCNSHWNLTFWENYIYFSQINKSKIIYNMTTQKDTGIYKLNQGVC